MAQTPQRYCCISKQLCFVQGLKCRPAIIVVDSETTSDTMRCLLIARDTDAQALARLADVLSLPLEGDIDAYFAFLASRQVGMAFYCDDPIADLARVAPCMDSYRTTLPVQQHCLHLIMQGPALTAHCADHWRAWPTAREQRHHRPLRG
jgi:hypothetical protein